MKKLQMTINTANRIGHINRELYGMFAEQLGTGVYGGIYVGQGSDIPNVNGIRTDVVEALKRIRTPLIRWPGGCFTEYYHWKDGIGPKEERRPFVNKWWGEEVDDASFGTHEFFDLCEQVGCEPYLVANNATSTPREIDEWIEYITYDGDSAMGRLRRKNGREQPWRLKYFCIGNEFFTCGGEMTPEFYASEYKRRMRFSWDYSGNKLYRIVRGMHANQFAITDAVVDQLERRHFDAYTIYLIISPQDPDKPVNPNEAHPDMTGSATDFTRQAYYSTINSALRIDRAIDRHIGIIHKRPELDDVRLIVDEWGTWYHPDPGRNPAHLYMQNTMRDAMVAANVLNVFNRHCNDLELCCLCMMVNSLDSIIHTDGEKMILTPTYHIFDLYKEHQDNELVDSFMENSYIEGEDCRVPALSQSVSTDREGRLYITLSNCSLEEDFSIDCTLLYREYAKCTGRILTGEVHAHNSFEDPCAVSIAPFDDMVLEDQTLTVHMPPCSVVSLILET